MRHILALTLAAFAIAPATALADTTTPEQTLSVLGRGVARVAPDVADISLGVAVARPTAVGARNSVNARTVSILSAIVGLGIPRPDVQTAETGLQREVIAPAHHGGKRRIRYLATSQLDVHLVDLAKVSPVLDAATRRGASSFDGPSFGFADPSAGRAAAEAGALTDARARADAAAARLGLRVTGVRSVDLDPESATVYPGTTQSAAAPAPDSKTTVPTPVAAGTEEVDSQVAVVFVLGAA